MIRAASIVRGVCVVLTAGLLLFAAGTTVPARAEAPSADDLPSLHQVYEQAKADFEEELRAAEAAKRDPIREAIESYRKQLVPLTEFQVLTDVMNDSEDEKKQVYRRAARDALLERFGLEPRDDSEVRRIRRLVGLEVIDLMYGKDPVGLKLVNELLVAWWRDQVKACGFNPTDRSKKRKRAYTKMKKYLQK